MEKSKFVKWLVVLIKQVEYAETAYSEIVKNMQPQAQIERVLALREAAASNPSFLSGPQPLIFGYIHSFLTHATVVSRVLSPGQMQRTELPLTLCINYPNKKCIGLCNARMKVNKACLRCFV